VTETGFGPVTVLTLAQTKKKANDYERIVAQGICPINAKRTERNAAIRDLRPRTPEIAG
jgi:hypothetical protein